MTGPALPAPGPALHLSTAWSFLATACALSISAGAALNLATGQGALGAGVLLITLGLWAPIQQELAAATQRLGPALWAPTAFLVACVWSSVATPAPWPGLAAATQWRPLLALPVLALLLASVRHPRWVTGAAVLFAAGCALHALIGLWQALTGDAPLADLLRVPMERRQAPAPDAPGRLAAVGLFYNRVRLSHVLAAGVAVSAGMGLWAERRRAWWWVLAGVSFAGTVLTYGRAALLSAVVAVAGGVAVTAWRRSGGAARRRVLTGAAVAAALGVGMVLAVPHARARLATSVDLSRNQDRLFLWGRGAEMAQDHLPEGTGFGGYLSIRDAYYDRVDDRIQSRMMSHNLLLSLLAETGVLGLMAWLWAWWSLWMAAARSGHPVAWSGTLGAATFHLAGVAHDPIYQSECALALAVCGALMTVHAPARPDAAAVSSC